MLRSKPQIKNCPSRPSPRRALAAIASVVLTTGALYVGLPTTEAEANFWWINTNEYKRCAADLDGLELTDEAIAEACASALHPNELSNCVVRIDRETTVTAETALAGCKRDRRPEDLAVCVVDIDRLGNGNLGDAALDYCRRSLLPLAFADCVTGLDSEIASIEPLPAMDICIAADDRPVEYLPDFVYPQPPIDIPATPAPYEPRLSPSTTITPMQPAEPAPQTQPVPALF